MFKKYFSLLFFPIGFFLLYFLAFDVQAINTPDSLNYPIAELGNCENKENCQLYCEQVDNMESCINFAEKNDLISPNEATIAKKAIVKIKNKQTPGGCNSKESCENFCKNNLQNLDSCISFAEEIGVSDPEIIQAKKIAAALKKGANLPGSCNGKIECETYCQDINHLDECLSFAEAAEILTKEEISEAKKVAPFLKSGAMPGGCQTKASCSEYCKDENHFEECLNFAEKAQLINKEEAEIARKTGGKGPGNCRSKAECEAYCNQDENAQTCADFAIEKGLVSEDEIKKIKEGAKEIASGLNRAPQEVRGEVEKCLNELFNGNISMVLSGQKAITKEKGEKINNCFQSVIGDYVRSKSQQGASAGRPDLNNPPDINEIMKDQDIEGAPPEVQEKIRNEIQEKIQQKQQEIVEQKKREIQSQMQNQIQNQIQNAPPGGQPSIDIPNLPNVPTVPEGSVPVPSIPSSNNINYQQGQPPANIPIQTGPPCHSDEECRAMFGGGR